MKTHLFKLSFILLLFTVTQTIAQTVEGDYGNEPFYEEIYFNGLALKPGKYITQEELKSAVEINPNRTDWGVGMDWNRAKISFTDEDDYHGSSSTFYRIDFAKNSGFAIAIVGKENDYGFVPHFSLYSSDIVIGFLNHKFIIGTTKKEEVEGLFYNGKVEKEYPSGSIRYTVYTHGGQLHFVFNKDGVLKSIYLQSF